MARVFASMLCSALLLVAFAAKAQAPFPPPALLSAQSVEAVIAAIGVGKPEFSSYLLLDVPEISLAGQVPVTVRSELPGTSLLILLRQFPVVPGSTAAAKPAKKPPARLGNVVRPSPPTAPPTPPTVLIAASKIEPGDAPALAAKFDFQRNERFTLLAFAQGRWFATARDVKLATPVE